VACAVKCSAAAQPRKRYKGSPRPFARLSAAAPHYHRSHRGTLLLRQMPAMLQRPSPAHGHEQRYTRVPAAQASLLRQLRKYTAYQILPRR